MIDDQNQMPGASTPPADQGGQPASSDDQGGMPTPPASEPTPEQGTGDGGQSGPQAPGGAPMA